MAEPVSILIVDDEPPLLRLMQSFLERMGYRVEGFANATDAWKRFEADPTHFRVVVTDLTLPDIPGNELAIRVLRANPEVGVLLCSGYPFEAASLPEDIRSRFATLQKPFLPNMLTQNVEALLRR